MKKIIVEVEIEVPDNAPEFKRGAFISMPDNATIDAQPIDGKEWSWYAGVFGDDGFSLILETVETNPPMFSVGQRVKLLYVDSREGVITEILPREDSGWFYKIDGKTKHPEHRLMAI